MGANDRAQNRKDDKALPKKPSGSFVIVTLVNPTQLTGKQQTARCWQNSLLHYHATGVQRGLVIRAMAVHSLLAFMVMATPTQYMYHLRRI